MATTTNFGWTKPTVGGDSDTWGTVLNNAIDAVDAELFAISPASPGTINNMAIGGSTPLAGTFTAGTFTTSAVLSGTGGPIGTTDLGYRGAPVNTQDANYTTVLNDAGRILYHTSASAHTHTIAANASVAYPIGTILLFENEDGAGNLTIAINSDTLRWGSSTGSRTLAANGSAVAKKMTATLWRLTGSGIT